MCRCCGRCLESQIAKSGHRRSGPRLARDAVNDQMSQNRPSKRAEVGQMWPVMVPFVACVESDTVPQLSVHPSSQDAPAWTGHVESPAHIPSPHYLWSVTSHSLSLEDPLPREGTQVPNGSLLQSVRRRVPKDSSRPPSQRIWHTHTNTHSAALSFADNAESTPRRSSSVFRGIFGRHRITPTMQRKKEDGESNANDGVRRRRVHQESGGRKKSIKRRSCSRQRLWSTEGGTK